MKHRFLSLLLVLAMVLSMWTVPVAAQTDTENITPAAETCRCGCGQTLDTINWTVWDPNTKGAPSSGHYYLADDYVQNKQQSIMSGDRVVLDLRGHAITTKDYNRLLLVYGRVYIMDTVGGGRFMAKTSGTGYGGIAMISTNETNDTLFELISGTIMPDPDNKGSRRGGLIHLAETATFRMLGGRLMNGSTINGTYDEQGGCVAGASSQCTIEILGGEIIGGESSSNGGNIYNVGTTILKDCKIIGGTAAGAGGNICQNGGTLTIENCVISDGVSNGTSNGGGNICVMTGTAMTLKNSTVRNGYANYHGGNLFMGTATGIVDNCVMEAGVCGNRGGNIYGSSSATALTIKDCQIPGDVTYIGQGLVLESLVKIGLLNNGLRLWYGDYTSVISAAGLTEGSEIYVDANHTFTEAGANAAYFKGAIRTVLSGTEESLAGTQAAAGEQGGYCPHCGQQVVWQAFSLTDSLIKECLLDADGDEDTACTGRHIESGHYYLTDSLTGMAQQYIGVYLGGAQVAKDVVVDLAGYHMTATGRTFYLRPGSDTVAQSSLTLLDSYGGSIVTGRGANNQGGGLIYNEGSKLTIYGGRYVYNPVSGRNIAGGGVLLNGGNLQLHGGIYDGSAFTYTDTSTSTKTYYYRGGALYQLNNSATLTRTLDMTAGRLIGGTAQIGGCVFFGYNNAVNISGGQFSGGVSDLASGGGGGCIRVFGTSTYKKADITIQNASIRDGSVTGTSAGGGNLSIAYGTYNIGNCYIAGGSVVSYGGNMTCGTSGNMTFTDCIIEGGTSGAQSGNIHVSATSATTVWDNCLIMNGTAKTYGGNITTGNGYNTIKGGQILFGTAATYGGNVNNSAGNNSATSPNYLTICADDKGNIPLIASGSAQAHGGNLYAGGVTTVEAARFLGGKAGTQGNDIYLNQATKQNSLTLGEGVTGSISMGVNAGLLGEDVYGEAIARTACSQLNATVTLEGDYNNALLCAKDGALYVGAIAVIDNQGNYTWFTDTASAVEACDADSYIRLYIAQDVVLTKDCAIDLCGQTVNFSGPYTLYGMDSSGDSYTAPTGKAIVAQETTVAGDTTAGGKRYIASSDETGTTFHRLENRITSVSLRPSAAGLYYTGSFGCDESIAAGIASYGVAVSTVNMPGKDFMTDEDTLYTNFDASTLVNGAQKTGVLISGIMKEEDRSAQLNDAYGKMPIFATSYLIMQDGTVILSDTDSHEDDVAYSLYDITNNIDRLITAEPLSYRKFTNPMRDFYNKWKDLGMGSWELNKINTPADDGVIDVLMIGSSFCYYYVEEMCGLAEAAGIPMRVCNVYYSGCPLEKHYNWWINGESNYQFFDTTYAGGRKQTNNVSLEWCLAQGEWDVISLQQSTSATRNDPNHLETTRLYYTTLLNYLMEQFPAAQMCWHQPWSYQIGYDRSGYQMTTFEQQQADMEAVQAYCIAICEEFDIQRINTGEAWQIVRGEYGYDELCARLGKGTDHVGDYYHDGDIGGGQYLNACVWFEIITGVSPVGNTYAPTYTYNGETFELDSDISFAQLQEAAHKAVEQLRAQESATEES